MTKIELTDSEKVIVYDQCFSCKWWKKEGCVYQGAANPYPMADCGAKESK